jgi:hypothetical protein
MVLAVSRIDCRTLARMVAAGSAWGLTLSAGFFIIALLRCGIPCPNDIAIVTTACISTGILTIGPLAAFGTAGKRLQKGRRDAAKVTLSLRA